jgi:pyruvate-ferredoxin/flavodoxin oxidoreductase
MATTGREVQLVTATDIEQTHATVDGNEAAASVAYRTNEVIAIYPITPASPMGELSDSWAARGQENIWGTVPEVIEMQSEAGAAGTVHGALQAGSLTTTFTASQGLLLMLPNMFKIAGELTPAVFHIAARSVATHALSIFGDHSDVMAARTTGWAMLASGSVQEAHDMALIAQRATLQSRVPFLHFFDGFRTSHEVSKIRMLSDDDIDDVLAHRARRLDPDRPALRGTAQNPDVFFQAREAANPFYDAVPDTVLAAMDAFCERTDRRYHLFDYVGAPDAETVMVMMGSGTGAAEEAVEAMMADGHKVGLVKVRLYRPFAAGAFVASLPPTVRTVIAMDRTKEPGAVGEPLYTDVVASLVEQTNAAVTTWAVLPRVLGGRYGLSSKEFTPAMAMAVFRNGQQDDPKQHFTIGITDDVTHRSLAWEPSEAPALEDTLQAVFYGLGSDGTVGANKNSVKIVGEHTDLYTQGHFVYDSRKSGAVTVSHLRFGPNPISSTYLIQDADFVACHQFGFLEKMDVLQLARKGATFLLNAPFPPDEVWDRIPVEVQRQIIEKEIDLYVVDGYRVASAAGLGGRINTVLQTCFFSLTDLLDTDDAVRAIKLAIDKTYARFGEAVLERNHAAVDAALGSLTRIDVPAEATSSVTMRPVVPAESPDFVKRVTAMMLGGAGDLLPVSAMPVDGTFPTGTTQYERRGIAQEIPIFDPEICIQCAKCTIVCPHAAIRLKAFPAEDMAGAPDGFKTLPFRSRDLDDHLMTIQVAPDDCTGCGVCVDVCPAKSKTEVKHKAINMEPRLDHLEVERANWDFFLDIPEPDRRTIDIASVKGSQLLDPLFEFSGACSGCGETPYLKLLTQLFGDRILVANATGCSSIYGGNLPTTPWRANEDGRGPAWSNSLFEDNAEFGLGMRIALDHQIGEARHLITVLADDLDGELVERLLGDVARDETGLQRRRADVDALGVALESIDRPEARRLAEIAGALSNKSVWIVGGDGWAYDIGFGGLDHALASGRNINILVLDTEVYSNTGGQASKATPRAAVAKFAASGKNVGKKDLGQIAMSYGNVYVAQIAIGANNPQTVKALAEAEAHAGPSLIIAYSTCIAHGIDMATSMSHQKELVDAGYWPLYRFNPSTNGDSHPFHLDSRPPKLQFKDVAKKEARFAMLERTAPEEAARLFGLAQADIDERWRLYEQLTDIERTVPHEEEEPTE